ncbi:MAG: hypothetical protein V4736_14390 [Bdellovibrionota bacterium]
MHSKIHKCEMKMIELGCFEQANKDPVYRDSLRSCKSDPDIVDSAAQIAGGCAFGVGKFGWDIAKGLVYDLPNAIIGGLTNRDRRLQIDSCMSSPECLSGLQIAAADPSLSRLPTLTRSQVSKLFDIIVEKERAQSFRHSQMMAAGFRYALQVERDQKLNRFSNEWWAAVESEHPEYAKSVRATRASQQPDHVWTQIYKAINREVGCLRPGVGARRACYVVAATLAIVAPELLAAKTRLLSAARTANTGKKFKTIPIQNKYKGEELGQSEFFRETKIRYYDDVEREAYRVTARDGKLYNAAGEPMNGKNLIFVMSEDGAFYAGTSAPGFRHHSSFLAGQPVAAAGEMIVENGNLIAISRKSGHYAPSADRLSLAIGELARLGLNTATTRVVEAVNSRGSLFDAMVSEGWVAPPRKTPPARRPPATVKPLPVIRIPSPSGP